MKITPIDKHEKERVVFGAVLCYLSTVRVKREKTPAWKAWLEFLLIIYNLSWFGSVRFRVVGLDSICPWYFFLSRTLITLANFITGLVNIFQQLR